LPTGIEDFRYWVMLFLTHQNINKYIMLNEIFSRYSAEEIHFNLMAIVSSRKAIHLKDIDRLNQRKTQILDQVSLIG